MTTTDEILAIAAQAIPLTQAAPASQATPADRTAPAPAAAPATRTVSADQAAAHLAAFAAAAARGMDSDVTQALRGLRPATLPGALPDTHAWRAWISATAAMAGTGPTNPAQAAPIPTQAPNQTKAPDPAQAAPDPIVIFAVCAAATALGDDCSAAVAAGVAAAALVESRLPGETGWSVPAISAVIGAGVAAGVMMRLPEPVLRHALGICATQAAGLRAAAGTDAGQLQAGKAAFNAVEAAQLAGLGFTSSPDPLDGRRALLALFGR